MGLKHSKSERQKPNNRFKFGYKQSVDTKFRGPLNYLLTIDSEDQPNNKEFLYGNNLKFVKFFKWK